MQLGGVGLISTVWQRDVARASPSTEPWLTSAHQVAHDSLMCHSVIPPFIHKAALLNIWWFWFVSLELPWHKGIQDEPADSSSLRYWKVSLWVMHSALQTEPPDCSRDVLCLNHPHLSCPHHTPGPTEWLAFVLNVQFTPRVLWLTKWVLQGNIFFVSMLRVQAFHLTYFDTILFFFIVSVQNITPSIMGLCT